MLIYKAVQSNIASKDKKKKWHPCLIKMGNVVDTQMIGETIAERSSLTAGDVHNVIRNRELLEALEATGWAFWIHWLTPLQVELIEKYLGEP